MASKVLYDEMDGTPEQICFRDSTDFSPTTANDLRNQTPTLVQLDLTSLANDAARQSAKVDLGAVRAPEYAVRAAIEFAATPVAGERVEFYWAPSPSSTAANANPGNVSGSDAAYTGYSSNLSDSLYHLTLIGVMRVTAQATTTVQVAEVGWLIPTERYGSLVVVNYSDAAHHSDAVESHIVFDPVFAESQ